MPTPPRSTGSGASPTESHAVRYDGHVVGAGASFGLPGGECFRLRHVRVEALLQARDARGVKWRAFTSAYFSRPGPEDGTLGLLLHGTSVVGFCSEEAASHGWSSPKLRQAP